MSFFLMSTRDVKTSPKRCRIFWHKRVFWLYVQGLILAQLFHLKLSII
jgi:hypothetical protein